MTNTTAEIFDDLWVACAGPLNTRCHIWQGRLSLGYGKTGDDWAHRESWRRTYGPIPNGLCVLHRCDVPSCVNPEHLFLGTKGDNIRDAAAKGRTCQGTRWVELHGDSIVRGEKHGRSKLVETDIERIQDLRHAGLTQKEIAAHLDISRPMVSLILRGKKWAHLHKPIRCRELRGGSGTNRGAARFRHGAA